MSVALAVLAGLAIAAPHVLRLESAHPATAAAIWFAALSLRALVALFFAVFVVLYLPTTALFDLVTHWCWHAVLPVLTTHLGLSGHSIGAVALLAPMLGLAASLMSVSFGLWRATRTIRAWVRSTSIAPGPQHSVIVGEHDAVAGAPAARNQAGCLRARLSPRARCRSLGDRTSPRADRARQRDLQGRAAPSMSQRRAAVAQRTRRHAPRPPAAVG